MNKRKLKIFTWHVHGSYLYYLSKADCDFYIPYKENKENGYGGKAGPFSWGSNVHEIAAEDVRKHAFDCILFQSKENYLEDQFKILSSRQRHLPKIYLEHEPPREHPTDTKHIVNNANVLIVHVTHFNNLMWDNGVSPTVVIEHGVSESTWGVYKKKKKGLVIINNLKQRGRRLGVDIYEKVKKSIPLDLIGMGSLEMGGVGEIPHNKLSEYISQYSFFFSPIRYTSLGLAVCEAMMAGVPIVALSTAEMATVIKNGVTGFASTNVDFLIEKMKCLLENPSLAEAMGKNAQKEAKNRFNLHRFLTQWQSVFNVVTQKSEHTFLLKEQYPQQQVEIL